MKKTLLSLLMAVCIYPQQMEIMGSEFSTGTSKSPAYMVELSGKLDGRYVTLTDYKMTAGKLLGFGRISAPDKIVFKPAQTDELDCTF